MPHRRRVQKGSFGGHFDELVVQFSAEAPQSAGSASPGRGQALQDRIDIHALLFEQVWKVEGEE